MRVRCAGEVAAVGRVRPVKRGLVVGAAFLAIVGAACGESGGGAGGGHDMDAMRAAIPGEAADASESDRTVQVEALDELAFSPESISVEKGEVVTFEVTNVGKTMHEFVLGDKAYQEMHEKSTSMNHDENGLALEPGQTASLTWRFSESGKVYYGCHEPGHYKGGMVGNVQVESAES